MARRSFVIIVLLGVFVLVSGGLMGGTARATDCGIETTSERHLTVEQSTVEVADTEKTENTSSVISSDKANIEYEFVGGFEERFRVDGYRNGHLGPHPDVRLGETLIIPIRVTNTGDAPETFELTLTKDGDEIEVKSGELGSGESTVVEFELEYVSVGNGISEIEIADWSTLVRVYDRDAMVLKKLNVSDSTVDAGDEVTVIATLENGDSPSTHTVEILNFNESIHTETVSLDAGESTTIETTHTIDTDYGAVFSVSGEFVTGSYTSVRTEWDINDTDLDYNDTTGTINESHGAINYTGWDFNESDIEINDSEWELNDSEWERNDSEWELNDSEWEVNDSDWEVNDSVEYDNDTNFEINESNIDINESNVTVNESELSINESDLLSNESTIDANDSPLNRTVSEIDEGTNAGTQASKETNSTGETDVEEPGFGIVTTFVSTYFVIVYLIRRG